MSTVSDSPETTNGHPINGRLQSGSFLAEQFDRYGYQFFARRDWPDRDGIGLDPVEPDSIIQTIHASEPLELIAVDGFVAWDAEQFRDVSVHRLEYPGRGKRRVTYGLFVEPDSPSADADREAVRQHDPVARSTESVF